MKTTKLTLWVVIFSIMGTFSSFSASSPLVISEFMASMSDTNIIADEDGESSDWIEIRNTSTNTVNLLGWYLTDSTNNLRMWRFPETNISAGGYLIVFASGKNRRTPGRPLHTNFRLNAPGEYLALVETDGVTIATEFYPSFPPQVPNVSFGFPNIVEQSVLVTTNNPVRFYLPVNDSLSNAWTFAEFNDSAWDSGVNGLGYDTGTDDPDEAGYAALLLGTGPVGYWRFSETSGSVAVNSGTLGASANGTYNGAVLGSAGPRAPQYSGFEFNNTCITVGPGTSYVSVPGNIMSGRGAFTFMGWIRPTATQANRTGLWGQNDCVEFGFITGSQIQLWTPNGGSLTVNYTFPIGEWHHVAAVGDGTSLRIYYDGVLQGTGGSATSSYGSSSYAFNIGGGGVFDASGNQFVGDIDEVAVWFRALSESEIVQIYQNSRGGSIPFNQYLKTDIRTKMYGVNSSVYIRIPFVVENPELIEHLVLRVKYDDGFVAYLNGTEILSVNAPLTNTWNSRATNRHPDSLALQFENFNISDSIGFLIGGTNVLAIQGLNYTATNTDFFFETELTAYRPSASSSQPVYFVVPTPGALNGVGSTTPGPLISRVGHFPFEPTDSDPITVTAKVSMTFYPVTAVQLCYRVMYAGIVTNDMYDDGLHGDGSAGDGIYGAVIPPEVSFPGQMVRWFIIATDSNGTRSRWPIFADPADSEEYLGTVIADPSINSRLPVVHLFVENVAASETRAGTRCSIYYLGEFYDNVFIHLRGQSSAGWNKKGFNIDFNRDHRFRYGNDGRRVKDIKLMSNWGDKARMRNTLYYEVAREVGCDGHFAFQVRVNRNGSFHAILDLMEDSDDLMLERLGRDPNGAFYKMYNRLDSTSGNEKKTRRWEGYADLQSLITNLAETLPLSDRVKYAYDNIELPQCISYFVASAIASHQDHGHKNYYLYRDSDGTGEWAILPWDVDLSWGRNWTDAQGYFTDTIYVDNVLNFYNVAMQPSKGATNRFYNLFWKHPEFRRMYLRRLRTVMDTYLQPPNTPPENRIIEAKIRRMMDLMDPPGVTNSDAYLDYVKWGYWGNNLTMRQDAQRIIDEYLPGRRQWLFTSPSATVEGDGIPPSQPPYVPIKIYSIEYNPISGNQLEEYICLTNPMPTEIDISGWRLDGAVQFTFKPGTVIVSNNVIYVSPNARAFRARSIAPTGGMGLYVVGPYQGNLSARGETIRLFNDKGYLIAEYQYPGNPSQAQQYLRITELMYNPPALPEDAYDADEYEFIELKNIGPVDLSLVGIRFITGITFDFTTSAVTNLAPGQTVMVVKNRTAFEQRYGGGFNVAGEYTGYLDNAGERIRLVDASGEEILDFTYDNRWHQITDGLGFSLVVANENAEPDAWNNKSNWRVSSLIKGTPGGDDPVVPAIPTVVVNEVLASSTSPLVDFIELYNPTPNEVNIGGWYLTDDFNTPKKFRIPDNTVIPPLGFVVFDESHFNPMPGIPPSFALSADGDEVYLFSAQNGELTGYVHGFRFGPSEKDRSLGRYITSDGRELLVPQSILTPGTNNAPPYIGKVVITEIMYHPSDIGTNDNSVDEYIEIRNISSEDVPLYEPSSPLNTMHLRGGVDMVFPTNLVLVPGQYLLVVNFDPSDTTLSNNFVAKYSVPENTIIVGPYQGKLNNDADDVELEMPIMYRTNIMYVQIDKVDYRDEPPWQRGADGYGFSLHRYPVNAFGNDPAAWICSVPTPGRPTDLGGQPPVIVSQSQSRKVNAGQSVVLTAVVSGSAPFTYQWLVDRTPIDGATNSQLIIPNIQPENTGRYMLVASNQAGVAVSEPIELLIILPPVITIQPQSVGVRVRPDPSAAPSTNATFTVAAIGDGPLSYQWRFNGVDIPGATNTTLTITNVQMSDWGEFTVAVSDNNGTVISQPAWLYPMVRPSFTLNPMPTTVPVGSYVTLSAEFFAWPPPFTTEWRRVSLPVATNVQYESNAFYTFQAPNVPSTNNYRLVVKNAASAAGSATPLVSVITVPDTDGDGMPDSWESANGFNPNDPADALLDIDGDGMVNWQEYVAGTDPKNPQSVLRIDSLKLENGVSMKFNAVTGRTYTVQFSTNLGDGNWFRLIDITAKPSNRVESIIDSSPLSPDRYYRITTPRVP